jgi:hypothetical protein
MKIFDEKHEAILSIYFIPKGDNLKTGDVVPHQKRVQSVRIYQRQILNDQEIFIKQEFTTEMILDLAEKIKSIQTESVEMPYDHIPF